MNSPHWRDSGRRRPVASRLGPTGSRRRQRFIVGPDLEVLEERITPTGNLAITNVAVVDANDQPLTDINAGEWVYIDADFNSEDLPSNSSYRVAFTVNGLTMDSVELSLGAGDSGTDSWTYDLGSFQACPGTNQVTATVDPDHSVPETTYGDNAMSITFQAGPAAAGAYLSYTVAQIRAAYGIDSIPDFGPAPADGSGQTIALDEAGNDPTILSDLDGFDQAMSLTTSSTETLYQQYGPASSFVTVYNQYGDNITADIADSGSDGVPAEDPTGHWEAEETMDVEWAHAIAPGARIDIIEVNDDANWPTNLLAGDALAAGLPGVSAVSNSWGLDEWSGETSYDSSTFVTPSGHTGVTFVTCSNDNGANVYPSPPSSPAPSVGDDGYYPATSPNVLSVGGTALTLDNDGYGGETAWSFPAPANTVDVGSASYAQSGSWNSQSGGFSGTYSIAAGGSSSSATWTIAVTPANTGWGTEISATWTPNPASATNATYTIYDGTAATGTILGTVTVDQARAPVGTADGNFQFQELGVFFPTLDSSGDGTLTVVLNAGSANGIVVADAVGAAQAWASTGGPDRFEPEPSYQDYAQHTGYRTTPDVALDASLNTGVICYQNGGLTYDNGGTSLSSPCWAALIAIANQGRVARGAATFNGPGDPTQLLQALYSMPSADFHQITSGYNGFTAGSGYDEITGLGTPIANLLIPDLTAYGLAASGPVFVDQPTQLEIVTEPPSDVAPGSPFTVRVAVEDAAGNLMPGEQGSVTISIGINPGAGTLGGTLTEPITDGYATFSDLTLDTPGNGYTLTASGGSLTPATTTAFDVTTGIIVQVSTPAGAGPAPAPSPARSRLRHVSTATSLAARPRSAVVGHPVSLTVTVEVHGRSRLVPAGDVTLWDGTTLLGTMTLSRGKGRLKTSSLPPGRDPIHVDYGGGGGLPGSSSAPVVVTIRAGRSRPKLVRPPRD